MIEKSSENKRWVEGMKSGHTSAFAFEVRFEKHGRLTIGRRKLTSTNSQRELVEQ